MARKPARSDGSAKVILPGYKFQTQVENSLPGLVLLKNTLASLSLYPLIRNIFRFLYPMPNDIKSQIQEFISLGKTEEALALLEQLTTDAVLLQSRYNGAKRQYSMGLIDFSEWSRTQAQINYSALEMMNAARSSGAPAVPKVDKVEPVANKASGPKPKVFISYSWDDKEAVREVKKHLESNQIDVVIDDETIKAGGSIMKFIEDGIKNCDVVLSIVSGKSLQSGWVGGESIAAMYAVWLADKKFIPVRLDNVVFDIDFQISAQETLNTNLKELKSKISKLEKLGGDAAAFREDLSRMNDLKNNLGKIIHRLKSVLMLDIAAPNFESSMKKVVTTILS